MLQQDRLSELGQAALEYARRGWAVFPCGPGAKVPAIADGRGQHDATTDEATILAWWAAMPSANIGVNLRRANIAVIDVDIYKPDCEWRAHIATHELPETLTQRSPRGGLHYIFTVQPDEEFPGKLCGGVDIKRNGYILLEPSVFEGKEYVFENDEDAQPMPSWVPRKEPIKDRPPRSISPDSPLKDQETWEILSFIDPDNAGYDEWISIIFAIHDRYDGNARGFEIAENWSAQGDLFEKDDIRNRWDAIQAGSGVRWATACKRAADNGADLQAISGRFYGAAQVLQLSTGLSVIAQGGGSEPPAPPEDEEPWREQLDAALIKNGKGIVFANLANALAVMEHNPAWDGCFAFDEFKWRKILTLPLPSSKTPRAGYKGREFKDEDYVTCQRWFQRNGFAQIGKQTVMDAVDLSFSEARFNELENHIGRLPEWDGTRRIGTWLHTMCGVEVTGDEAQDRYVREVGARWLMSAIARATQPGCKADAALILEGPQGAGKSSALRILAGAERFGDALPPMGSKDAKEYVRGKWIIELAELANMNKAEVEEIKAFITRQEERFRPPYGRGEVSYMRQCVFAGTTNKSDYLRDETGNRRFWPVRVGAEIDLEAIEANRDQLWAEALHCVAVAKMPWWLPDDVEATQRLVAASRYSEDPWHSMIENYCVGRSEVCISQIFDEVLEIEKGRRNRSESNRVSGILVAIGFVQKNKIKRVCAYTNQKAFRRDLA